MPDQRSLFAAVPALPDGLSYRPELLAEALERDLSAAFRKLPFEEAQYKEWRAKRRIVSYGSRYDFSRNELLPAAPVPALLHPLRDLVAEWSGIPAEALEHALIAEYRPGTALGWHRDVPSFGKVVGVSLAGAARMRFRPYPPRVGGRSTFALDLEPRSAYAMVGTVRWRWQHAISPTKALRYSVTFRTSAIGG